MFLHLVIPGLVWPKSGVPALTTGLSLPGLARLLGHARVRTTPAISLEDWLARAFGITGETIPYAALRRLGEADGDAKDQAGQWLCADPAHLHFAREHLLLSDATDLAISGEEAHALVGSLNAFLCEHEPDLGQFEVATPTRWYLRLTNAPDARFVPLTDVVGRPIKHFMPEGKEAQRWQRLTNELQIVLHNDPINRAREAAGQRTLNSLWFWGNGSTFSELHAPVRSLQASSPLAHGLARAAGIHPQSPHPLPDSDAMVVLEGLRHATLYLDIDTWRQALQSLETDWLAPTLTALKTRRISALRITAPGDRTTLDLEIGPSDLWKFWRQPRSLDSILTSIP